MCCDYRVMASGKFTIGLNETKLGIVAPAWMGDLFVQTVGARWALVALLLGSTRALHAMRTGIVTDWATPAGV